MHTRTHIRTHTHTHTLAHIYKYTHTHVYIYTYTNVCIHTYTLAHPNIQVFTCSFKHARIKTHPYKYTLGYVYAQLLQRTHRTYGCSVFHHLVRNVTVRSTFPVNLNSRAQTQLISFPACMRSRLPVNLNQQSSAAVNGPVGAAYPFPGQLKQQGSHATYDHGVLSSFPVNLYTVGLRVVNNINKLYCNNQNQYQDVKVLQ